MEGMVNTLHTSKKVMETVEKRDLYEAWKRTLVNWVVDCIHIQRQNNFRGGWGLLETVLDLVSLQFRDRFDICAGAYCLEGNEG